MKRIATKAAALFGVVLVLFTMFAALPVYADDYKLEDWLTGWTGDLFWGTMDQLYKYVDYTDLAPQNGTKKM